MDRGGVGGMSLDYDYSDSSVSINAIVLEGFVSIVSESWVIKWNERSVTYVRRETAPLSLS